VALDQMPAPGSGLRAHEVEAILHTCRLVGGTAAMRILAAYGRHFDQSLERQLIEMWRDFDRGEYARVVLSALSEISWLTVDAELLPHLSGLSNLIRLRIDGRVPSYEVVEQLENLHELTLVNPPPELSGLSAPSTLRALSIIGRVEHRSFQRLLLPRVERLHAEIGSVDPSVTSWQLLSGLPEATRRSITGITTDSPLSKIDIEHLSGEFPALDILSVRSDDISSIDGITYLLQRLREHTSITTFRLSIADTEDLGHQIAQSIFVDWQNTTTVDDRGRRCQATFTRRP